MSATPPEPTPDSPGSRQPFSAHDETMASAQRNAAAVKPASSSGSVSVTFRSKERDFSGTQMGEYKLVRKIAVSGMDVSAKQK